MARNHRPIPTFHVEDGYSTHPAFQNLPVAVDQPNFSNDPYLSLMKGFEEFHDKSIPFYSHYLDLREEANETDIKLLRKNCLATIVHQNKVHKTTLGGKTFGYRPASLLYFLEYGVITPVTFSDRNPLSISPWHVVPLRQDIRDVLGHMVPKRPVRLNEYKYAIERMIEAMQEKKYGEVFDHALNAHPDVYKAISEH